MKDTQFDLEKATEIKARSQKYHDAVRALDEAKAKREQQGFAAMYTAMGMAGGYHELGKPGRIVVAARTFCILFAFAAPNLILLRHLMS